jgi:hypothetical protein
MNLGSISLIVSTAGGVMAILGLFYKAIRYNNARGRAQQGRITSLYSIVEIQGERTRNIEIHLALPESERGKFQANEGLVNLEFKAINEYEEHHTSLT